MTDNKFSILVLAVCLFLLCGCEDTTPVAGPYPTEGIASWYMSRITATGERMQEGELTCAMRKRDFGKHYKVCNRESNDCVVVRHNNFGPSRRKYNEGRIIDLSKAAFSSIAKLDQGLVQVTVHEVGQE